MDDTQSRRNFLKACAALGITAGGAPLIAELAAINAASAATPSGYKALVCVFLEGGNDYANTFPPYDLPSYNLYQAARPLIAHGRASLAATVLNPITPLAGGRQYAMAPTMAPLLPVFDAGKMAVVLNVGPNYFTFRPMSHPDQVSYWQTMGPEDGGKYGWGGAVRGPSALSLISTSNNSAFLSRASRQEFVLGATGPVPLLDNATTLYGSAGAVAALKTVIGTAASDHELEVPLASIGKRALDNYGPISTALAAAPPASFPLFPVGNPLADQLKMVARMIASSQELGIATRQIFFVSLGGFDMHNGLAARHPMLIGQVASAMRAFYDTTVAMGIADRVTAFTASEFGRALCSSNDGSDAGWGGMHFVVGGAVNGRQIYGKAPAVGSNTADDIGQGRLKPQFLTEQYAATLISWLGLSAGSILPNLSSAGNPPKIAFL
jgi:uncharacterized protein (DUF1501 family)